MIASEQSGPSQSVYIPRFESSKSNGGQNPELFMWPSTDVKSISVADVTWLDHGTSVKCDAQPTPISHEGPTQTAWSVDDSGLIVQPEMPAWLMSVDSLAHIYYNPPDYPEAAKEQGVQGKANIGVTVGPSGAILAVWLLKSSGSQLLDDAGMRTAKQTRYDEPLLNGKPTAATFVIDYDWRLY